MFSRRATNLSAYFPDVVSGCSLLDNRDAILDGEIIVLDERMRPNFGLLQRRLQTPRPPSALQRRRPARLVVFDVLHLDGRDLTGLPYRERRGVLEGLSLSALSPALATSPAWLGVDGREILLAMADAGMEGVVCKAQGSIYRAGHRSRQWIKTPYRHSGHFVVGGYSASRAGSVGALLVGAYDAAGNLTYCGTVSVGFTDRARRDLASRFAPMQRDTSPFDFTDIAAGERGVCWVEPVVVGRVVTARPDAYSVWSSIFAVIEWVLIASMPFSAFALVS